MALQADDAHGVEHELTTRHHRIAWADLAAVLRLAAAGAAAYGHGTSGNLHDYCHCAAVFAVGRVRDALDWDLHPAGPPVARQHRYPGRRGAGPTAGPAWMGRRTLTDAGRCGRCRR